jgi:gas vesicle protein
MIYRSLTVCALAGLLLAPFGVAAGTKTAFLFKPLSVMAQEEGLEEPEEEAPQDFVDPREIRNEVNQSNDQLREIKRILSRAKKGVPPELLDELKTIKSAILEHQKKLKALLKNPENAREVLDEYREAQYWEQINPIRQKIDMPHELKEIGLRTPQLEKQFGKKRVRTLFTELGGDPVKMDELIKAKKEALAAVKAKVAANDWEDIDSLMETFWQDGHPGEALGILGGLEGFSEPWRMIKKDSELKDAFKAMLSPIMEALSEGDWREARMIAEETRPIMEKLMRKIMQVVGKKRGRGDVLKRLADLEKMIEEKLGKEGGPEEPEEGEEEEEE